MWLVLKLLEPDEAKKLDSRRVVLVPVVDDDQHYGFLPLYRSYQSVVKDFPHTSVVSLGDMT